MHLELEAEMPVLNDGELSLYDLEFIWFTKENLKTGNIALVPPSRLVRLSLVVQTTS